jgi:hypothetical protein
MTEFNLRQVGIPEKRAPSVLAVLAEAEEDERAEAPANSAFHTFFAAAARLPYLGVKGSDQQNRSQDARGIAQMMRAGPYRLGRVKTLRSQKLRMLLTHCKLVQSKAIA